MECGDWKDQQKWKQRRKKKPPDKEKEKSKFSPSQDKEQLKMTIKVVRDEGDHIPQDRVLPVELPVLMRADAYLNYEDFKTMLEYQLRPTDPVEQWYDSLPMFMKKGQTSKLSAHR